MAIPTYQSLLLPVLKAHAVLGECSTQELVDHLARELQLSDEDLDSRIPSGANRFRRRVEWARFYLLRAGTLTRAARGRYVVTPRGQSVLSDGLSELDNQYLSRFPEFIEWLSGQSSKAPQEQPEEATSSADSSPEEMIGESYTRLRVALEQELLERVLAMPPSFFEDLVVELLLRLGYGGALGEGQRLGRSGDGGVDGLIREDALGLERVYVQAKRWSGTVGRPEVQAFAGSLEGQRSRKGVMLTTSAFSSEAREYVERIEKRIVLIDGAMLASLMFERGLGVSTSHTFEIKRIDTDFFDENEVL